MIVVTYEMGFAREVSGRTIFLHRGRIEEEGPPCECIEGSSRTSIRGPEAHLRRIGLLDPDPNQLVASVQ